MFFINFCCCRWCWFNWVLLVFLLPFLILKNLKFSKIMIMIKFMQLLYFFCISQATWKANWKRESKKSRWGDFFSLIFAKSYHIFLVIRRSIFSKKFYLMNLDLFQNQGASYSQVFLWNEMQECPFVETRWHI